jgi:hypothetical protein
VRCIEAGLDEVLALRLGDERLQFGGCESVDQTSFRDDEEKDLCSGQGGKLVSLFHDTSFPF